MSATDGTDTIDPWGFTTGKAIAAAIAAVASALIGVLVAAGLHVRPELRDSIITFITVTTPFVVVLIGWLHHAHAKVIAAAAHADATGRVAAQVATRRRAPGAK